ncbi:MAG: glycosyltransferase [Vicinamibacterales bacterium]|nr:glycosyltransferase [Vicinamibacterales bacterium]
MHVVHVAAYYAPAFTFGGPPRSIHGLCRALRAAGCDARVLTTDADGAGRLPGAVTSLSAYEGVPVRYCRTSWPRRVIGSRDLEVELRATVAGADVVHIHGLWNRVVWAAARIASEAGVPYVLSPRGMLDDGSLRHHRWRKRLVYPFTDRRTVAGAALVHATSEQEAAGIGRWAPAARVVVIPNGVDAECRDTGVTRRDLGLPEDDAPLVVSVARLHPVKRLDLLIDAFATLTVSHPRARLVIAGPDEQGLRAGLDVRAGRHATAIAWLGAVDAARRDALLRHASVLVMCSDSESFGLSVVEAMRAGVPVVVADTCGWGRVAEEGAGYVVPQSSLAIAQGIGRVLADPAGAAAMGLRGRAFASREFAWPSIASRFISAYQNLVAPRAAS